MWADAYTLSMAYVRVSGNAPVVSSDSLTPTSRHTINVQQQSDVFVKTISTLVQSVLKPAMDRGVVKGKQVSDELGTLLKLVLIR